jgi:hypothetical protein
MKSEAWRALSVGARATFLELKKNYNTNVPGRPRVLVDIFYQSPACPEIAVDRRLRAK